MTKERAKLSSTWMRWKELQIPRLRRDDKGEGEALVHMDVVERTADPSASLGMTKERAKLSSTWMWWKELQIPRLRSG